MHRIRINMIRIGIPSCLSGFIIPDKYLNLIYETCCNIGSCYQLITRSCSRNIDRENRGIHVPSVIVNTGAGHTDTGRHTRCHITYIRCYKRVINYSTGKSAVCFCRRFNYIAVIIGNQTIRNSNSTLSGCRRVGIRCMRRDSISRYTGITGERICISSTPAGYIDGESIIA